MISLGMLEIVGPALIIGFIIALSHSLLGLKVLDRGIIFIDLAIAQIAALGLISGELLWPEHSWIHQITALTYALLASSFFYYIEKKSPDIQEAIIGSCFVLSASFCILLLADHPHGSDEIKNLMSGQILFVTYSDIIKHSSIYLLIITLWFLKPKIREGIWFYLIFAFAITSSVQLVGIYVVFASLILPAISAKNKKNPLTVAAACGAFSVITGVVFAIIFDLPAGVVIVISYVVIALLITLISCISRMQHQQFN